ncbi:hypothetical protein CMK19_15490 [Candidatus Poribacteria bacterium]|nr:hypothetical protein [Candidatus Poribacteria bacterium]|tara:strand:- start:566 stop:1606 length:1041 start_codon:yes stop_codon:yes gene_type:complete
MRHVALLLAVFLFCTAVFSQTTVYIDPAEVTIMAVGKTVECNISISEAKNVLAYQFKLIFDETAVKFISLENANFLPAQSFAVPAKTEVPGEVLFGATSLGNASELANGTLAIATFEILAKRDSALNLSEVKLSDPEANNIPAKTIGMKLLTEKIPVATEHEEGGQILTFKAEIRENGEPVKGLADVWNNEQGIQAEKGQFIEYQSKFATSNPYKVGGVYVMTKEGDILEPSNEVQQMRLIENDGWVHRKLPLDSIAGKTISAISIGTEGDSGKRGLFVLLVDNIQLTDGNSQIMSIWNSQSSFLPKLRGETVGLENVAFQIGTDEVAVAPRGKITTTWSDIKISR